MAFVRRDVWALSDTVWSPTLEWYAKGVGAMQARAFSDPTSWWFLAAMHGIDRQTWDAFGYAKGQQPPALNQQRKYLQKCQHQSWYFLPWHRGYLASFEAIVRDAVVKLGGPDDWALPYWNYNNPAISTANTLPPAFASKTMQDGSKNPLFVPERYGDGNGHFVLDLFQDIPLDALGDDGFEGGDDSVPPGFGGPVTVFHHGGEDGASNGHLENIPHNQVHGAIGGLKPGTTFQGQRDPRNMGLMSHPNQAALDPIFWLHHANIDRLWESWRQSAAHAEPSDTAWLDGPVGKPFFVPKKDGGEWQFAARAMLDTTTPDLNYTYEELTPLPPSRVAERVARLGLPAHVTQSMTAEGRAVSQDRPAELIGSNEASVDLSGGTLSTGVKLDRPSLEKVTRSMGMAAAPGQAKEPDRVFLKLENIRGANDAAIYYVYVGLSPDADPKVHPQNFAGALSFFGVSKASVRQEAAAGNGLTQVIEITKVVDAMHLSGKLASVDELGVRFVPRGAVNYGGDLSIGRVTIFRKPK